MPYTARIERANPSCFLFLIDQSGSMADPWAETNEKKADKLAVIVNRFLQELILTCVGDEGVRDRFYIGVIGYGTQVGPAFIGPLAGKELVPISEVANMPARVEEITKKIEDGAGGLVDQSVKFPIWFDPIANGGTPMCQALSVAAEILRRFIDEHPDCFPPVVIHLTDGESTDGDPTNPMQEITSLSSSDGNVLLFNYHISSLKSEEAIAFPHSHEVLPADPYARMLFDAASELTPLMLEVAKEEHGFNLSPGAKGFIFNADSTLVIQGLDIGSTTSLR